jgi:methylated-DNA-protein-cysteine methyltransferase related protein
MAGELRERIYALVRKIPAGAVTTYGAVARRIGCGARQVGYAMAALPAGSSVPWHRVLNSRGEISIPGDTGVRQRALLLAEGIAFDARGRVDLDRYGSERVRDRTEME